MANPKIDLTQLPDDVPAQNQSLQQVIQAWQGLVGHGIPLNQREVRDDQRYAVDIRNRGLLGLHLRIQNSSTNFDILNITDAGINVSPDGTVTAGNFFVFPLMYVGWHSSAPPPVGWFVCDGLNGTPDLTDRFLIGAGGSVARGGTGGSGSASIDHNHLTPSHAHSHSHGSATHGHTHAHTSAPHSHGHNHTGSTTNDGTGGTSPDGDGTTTSDGGGVTGGPNSTVDIPDGAGGTTRHPGDGSHTHNGSTHSHHGPLHTHSGPSHSHSLSGVSTDSTSTTPGLVGIDTTDTTPGNTLGDATSGGGGLLTTTGGGSISIVPPFYGSLQIMRGA